MRSTWLLAAAAGLLLAVAPLLRKDGPAAASSAAAHAAKAYHVLETKMEGALQLALTLESDSALQRFMVHGDFRRQGLYLVLDKNGVPWYWSDNKPDFLSLSPDSIQSGTTVRLGNGVYRFFKKTAGQRRAIGLLLLANNYAYQNQYLVNEMNPELHLPEGTVLAEHGEAAAWPVIKDGHELFHVRIPGPASGSMTPAATVQALALFLLLLVLFRVQRSISHRSLAASWLFIAAVVALRWAMVARHWPSSLYETFFFSPQLYASSSWFNSPGDLLLNVVLVFMLSYGFASSRRERPEKTPAFLYLVSYAIAAVLLNSLVSGLVLNSRISFDVSNLFELNQYTAAGLFIVLTGMFALFLFARGIAYRLHRKGTSPVKIMQGYLLALALVWASVLGMKYAFGTTFHFSWIDAVFATALLALQVLPGRGQKFTLNFFLVNILLFSMYSAAMLLVFNQRKEMESRRVLVSKLQANQDTVAEFLFDDVQRNISADKELKHMFANAATGQDALSRRVSRLYLSGYWSRYESTVTGIRKNGMPFDTITGWSFDKALQYIKDHGEATSNNYLYSSSAESGRLSYISMIPITSHDSLLGHLLIRLDEKLLQLDEGFPELFISSKAGLGKRAGNYSYARYTNGKLTYQQGDFSYFFSLRSFGPVPIAGEQLVVNLEGYSHLLAGITPGNYIIISRKRDSPLLFFNLFSYIAALLSLSTFAWYAVTRLRKRHYRFSMSLKKRIQLAVVSLVVLSVLLIGGETISFLVHRYDDSQSAQIRTRVNSLSLAIENLLKRRQLLPMPDDEARISLNQAAATRNVDFNLFAMEGYLLFSTQPKIFEQGIMSSLMDPEALYELRNRGRTGFVHPENVGRLNYIAAYEPIRDSHGNTMAYLGLPYFEKQNERNREISSFLSTLINTYVLMLALAVVLALLIASRITEPLRIIQEKIGRMHLGRVEPIAWNSEDEIGELVTEYNRMVAKLEASAARLAQSERESAWREMARQVAHEIKNPLTPMKLSLQHLQKSWNDQDPRREELLERVSRTLVEQIDSLSGIATAFADFARMPDDKKDAVNLNQVVNAVSDLFHSEELPVITELPGNECIVLADKDQLMRLLSNLIKNGMQSIPPGRKGMIHISLKEEATNFLVTVTDNGSGIPKDLITKIFEPNFTTKGSGMGLGLSMARRITENFGGKIWFKTEADSGSTFYVSLPKITS